MTLQFVTRRDDLGADDFLEWSSVASVGSNCPWDLKRHGVPCESDAGLAMLITGPGPNILRVLQQGELGLWAGNFADGDVILHAVRSTLPIVINFGKPVAGAGAQIQPQGIAGAFQAVLEVFFETRPGQLDSQAFPFLGNSTNANDGSAIFVGAKSERSNIRRLEFHTTGMDGVGCPAAINRLSISTTPGSPAA